MTGMHRQPLSFKIDSKTHCHAYASKPQSIRGVCNALKPHELRPTK